MGTNKSNTKSSSRKTSPKKKAERGEKDGSEKFSFFEGFLFLGEIEDFEDSYNISLRKLKVILLKKLDFKKSKFPLGKEQAFSHNSLVKKLFYIFKSLLDFYPLEKAESIFYTINPSELRKKEAIFRFLHSSDALFHTRLELAFLCEAFRSFLKNQEPSLLQTGFPNTGFLWSPWLTRFLGPLLFTKVPSIVLPPLLNSFLPSVRPWTSIPQEAVFWESARFPVVPLEEIPSLSEFSIWSYMPPSDQWTHDESTLVGFFHGFQGCLFNQASHLRGLAQNTIRSIEAIRSPLWQAKIEILDILYRALVDKHSEEIWPKTVGVLTTLFTREDIDFLMKIDGFFSEHGIGDRGLLGYTLPQYVVGNGGISALLTFAAFVEKEILLGTYHRTKFELSQDLHQQMPVWSYLQVLDNPALPHINRTLDNLLRLEEKEVAFWETFESRTVNTLNSEFETELNIRVKLPTHKIQEFQSSIQALANMQAENVRGQKTSDPLTAANLPIPASSADHFPKKSSLKKPVVFPTPPGTTWPQVTIKFIAPDKAKVSAGHATKVYTFQEMGFEDRRSTDKPNLLWKFLTVLGSKKEIDWENVSPGYKGNLKSIVKQIRHHFRGFFNIADDPFEPYRQFNAYRPKFRVERAFQDE